MLSEEQSTQIKEQLIEQINSAFPEDKKAEAISQVEAMDNAQLEEFLKKNNMVQNEEGSQQCVFCSIADSKTPSYKLAENEKALAVLEINPISKGHVIIIPKEHGSMPKEAEKLAQELSKKIKEKFSPKEVTLTKATLFNHEILNVLPVYKAENMNSEKHKASKEELEAIQKQLATKPKKKIIKKPKPRKLKKEEKLWLPKRIP